MSRHFDHPIRAILSEILGEPDVLWAPDDTPLFRGGLGLTSIQGAALLQAIKHELHVEVAEIDLALTCLDTVGTLSAFVDANRFNAPDVDPQTLVHPRRP